MTKHTLSESQHQQMPINDSPAAALTSAALRSYLKEPGHMPIVDQQSMQKHCLHAPKISKKI